MGILYRFVCTYILCSPPPNNIECVKRVSSGRFTRATQFWSHSGSPRMHRHLLHDTNPFPPATMSTKIVAFEPLLTWVSDAFVPETALS